MSERTQRTLSAALHSGPTAFLKSQGFRKNRLTFHRGDRTCGQYLNFQHSVYSVGATGGFTINLAVHFPAVEKLRGRLFQVGPSSIRETIEERIGDLLPSKWDHWWKLNSRSNPKALGEDLVAVLRDFALPWLARASRLESVKAMFLERESFQAASAVCLAMGMRAEAKRWAEAEASSVEWRNHALLTYLKRSGLSISPKALRRLRSLPTYDEWRRLSDLDDTDGLGGVEGEVGKRPPPCKLPYCKRVGHF